MNILILGCSGQIGSRLTNSLLEYGFKVHGIRGSNPCTIKNYNHECRSINLLNSNEIRAYNWQKIDVLIHTAWVTTPGIFEKSEKNNQWVNASKNIIQAFEKSGGKYLVVTSTCFEYDLNSNESLSENSTTNPITNYGRSKLELFKWIQSQNIPFLWTRIFFQYGLNEGSGRLIPSMIDCLVAGKIYEIQNPNNERDFIYINDVVEILKMLVVERQIGVFNLGTGIGIKLSEIANLVAEITGRRDLVHFLNLNKSGDKIVANPTKLMNFVGNFQWTSIESGLANSVHSRINLKYEL